MLRHSRLVMMVLVAMFVVAVPMAVAQTPVASQYQSIPPASNTAPANNSGTAPTNNSGTAPSNNSGTAPTNNRGRAPSNNSGTAPSNNRGADAPVNVSANAPAGAPKTPPAAAASLPFTGGQVSLVALIGLGLLALGVVGVATARRRGSSTGS